MKSQFRAFKYWMGRRVPNPLYLPFINTKNAVQRRRHSISYTGDGIYQVDDHERTIFISERTRHNRYKRGISRWVNFLASQYKLDQLDVRPQGVFIDCGANIGELGLWASSKGLSYHAFEPEAREANCCDRNNFGGQQQTMRKGLWHETTELKFYSKPESADSSFIEIANFSDVKTVPVTTLDEYVRAREISEIEIFKVEAEGAEPEVLCGAKDSLPICRYVAVDCGRERGVLAQDTVRDVCNIMYQYGFSMADGDMNRLSILFQNRANAGRKAA